MGYFSELDIENEEQQFEKHTKEYVKITGRALPFKCTIFDFEPVEVTNPFSGEGCLLEPDAVAVYDMITGGNLTGNYELVRQGCDWFRQHFPKQYMILLD
jgi:hypothetical protein